MSAAYPERTDGDSETGVLGSNIRLVEAVAPDDNTPGEDLSDPGTLQHLRDRVELLSAYALLASGLPEPLEPSDRGEKEDFDLTPKEIEMLRMSAKGLTDKEIAAELVISHGTVKFHHSNAYMKMGVRGKVEALNLASQNGLLVEPDPDPEPEERASQEIINKIGQELNIRAIDVRILELISENYSYNAVAFELKLAKNVQDIIYGIYSRIGVTNRGKASKLFRETKERVMGIEVDPKPSEKQRLLAEAAGALATAAELIKTAIHCPEDK